MNISFLSFGQEFVFENVQTLQRRINEVLSPQQQVIIGIALAALSCLAAMYAISRCWEKLSEGEMTKSEILDKNLLFSSQRTRSAPKKTQSRLSPQQTSHASESIPKASPISEKKREMGSDDKKKYQRGVETPEQVLIPIQAICLEKVSSKEKEKKKKDIFLTPADSPALNKKAEWSLGDERKYQWIETPKKALTAKEKIQLDQFEEGILTGKASIEFPDGEKWTGDFKQSLFDGFGRIDFADGKVLEAEFEEGKIVNVLQLAFSDEEIDKESDSQEGEGSVGSSPARSPKKNENNYSSAQLSQLIEQLKNYEENKETSSQVESSYEDEESFGWLYEEQEDEIERKESVLEEEVARQKSENLLLIPKEIEQQREQEMQDFPDEEKTWEDIDIFFLLETTDEQLATIKAVDIEEELDSVIMYSVRQEGNPISQFLPNSEMGEGVELSFLNIAPSKEENAKEQSIVKTPLCFTFPHLEITKPIGFDRKRQDTPLRAPIHSQSLEERRPIDSDLEKSEKKEVELSPQSKIVESNKKEEVKEQILISELESELLIPPPIQKEEQESVQQRSPVEAKESSQPYLEGVFTPNGKNGYGKISLLGTIMDGEFKEGMLDCRFGKIIFKDGSSQEGEYKQGKLHGLGKIIYANGDVVIGNFKKGYLNGQGKMEFADGRVLLGTFSKGMLQGKGSIISPQRREHPFDEVKPLMRTSNRENKVLKFFSSFS